MAKKYLDDTGMSYFWGKLKDYFQAKLVSGTNIKTINNESVLGSGDISVTSIEVVNLDTKATLYRVGNMRILVLNEYTGASNTLHVESEDAPSIAATAPSIVRGSNGLSVRTGQATVSAASPYYVHRYYAGTYNASNVGLASVSSTDMTSAVIVWSV